MRRLNRKQIIKISISIITALLVVYIVTRFGHLITGPRIKIDSVPKDALTTSVVTLSGTIKGGRLFWINGAQIPIEKNGRFETQLVVPPGYTIITLEAEDELGSRRTKVVPIYYLPPEKPTEQASEETIINEQ